MTNKIRDSIAVKNNNRLLTLSNQWVRFDLHSDGSVQIFLRAFHTKLSNIITLILKKVFKKFYFLGFFAKVFDKVVWEVFLLALKFEFSIHFIDCFALSIIVINTPFQFDSLLIWLIF